MFSANRWELKSLIEEHLLKGINVILDRYVASGVAYSSAKGLDFEWCLACDIGLIKPDVTIFMEIDSSLASSRGDYGKEIYEKKEFQRIVNEKFKLLQDDSWSLVDASQDPQDIHQEVKKIISNLKTDNIEFNYF